MAFSNGQPSLQESYTVVDDTKVDAKRLSFLPSPQAVENVPMKRKRTRTTSTLGTSHLMKRVSSIFTARRKGAPPDLQLVDSVLADTPPRRSFSSQNGTIDSEESDDIRIPSGLGSAATMLFSDESLPPSPFPAPFHNGRNPSQQQSSLGEYQRTRALSSPNLLRSISVKMRGRTISRRASITLNSIPTIMTPPRKPQVRLPKEIIIAILSCLPRSNVLSCSTVSRTFLSAVRTSLYSTLDFDLLSTEQSEQLVMQLVSRSDLTDLVTTFVCRTWPSFFLPDTGHDALIIHPRATLLTAVFTLALERMTNLTILVLPAFDISLLAHHSAFGLKSLTFLHSTTTDVETKALLTWLDGQTNITTLLYPNLEDTSYTKTTIPSPSEHLIPHHDNTLSKTAHSSHFLKIFPTSLRTPDSSPSQSPKSGSFVTTLSSSSHDAIFSSPTLLPNLTKLHATPTLMTQLATPTTTSCKRPLRSVTLNIHTTLYNGLRPAALMNALHGVTHLSLRFGETVDRRSFEKVLGAAGASLGRPTKKPTSEDPFAENAKGNHDWDGLQSLDIAFHTGPDAHPGRDEALYKSLQASLPRYKALSSLRLLIAPTTEKDSKTSAATPCKLSAPEQVLLDSWAKLCPTLRSITLFSGAQWQNKTRYRVPQERKPMEAYGFKFPSIRSRA